MALEGACGVGTETEDDGSAHVVDESEEPDSIMLASYRISVLVSRMEGMQYQHREHGPPSPGEGDSFDFLDAWLSIFARFIFICVGSSFMAMFLASLSSALICIALGSSTGVGPP